MQSQKDLSATFVRAVHFSTGHSYVLPGVSEKENRETYGSSFKPQGGLGHNFRLEAFFHGPIDELTGMSIDLVLVDRMMKEVTAPLDHHYLNSDVEFFKPNVPTAENIARYCFEGLQTKLENTLLKTSSAQTSLLKVRLQEGESLWVEYAK